MCHLIEWEKQNHLLVRRQNWNADIAGGYVSTLENNLAVSQNIKTVAI